ncbi:MAG TPA: ATP-binding protein [Actinomycetota bacterium]|nr:ATP-binding protein [Actinomycetota bacterium]
MFSIELPASAEHISTARIFAAAVARHFGCDAGDIEDLKIVLSEACGSAISHSGRGSNQPVKVRATPSPGLLTFEINADRKSELERSAESAPARENTEEQMLALSAELIAALFPDAEFLDSPEGTFFRLSVAAPTAA